MTRMKSSRPLRIIAVFLAAVCVFFTAVLSVGIFIIAKDGFYTMSPEPLKEAHLSEEVMLYVRRVAHYYFDTDKNKEAMSRACPNVWFEVRDVEGNLLLSNYSGEKYRFTESDNYTYYIDVYTPNPESSEFYDESTQYPVYDEYGEIKYYITRVGKTVNVTVYVKETLEEFDMFALTDQLFDTVYSFRHAAIALCAVAAVLFVILFIFLMSSAGHRKGHDGIALNFFDKIPFDIVTEIVAVIGIEEVYLMDAISSEGTLFFLASAAVLVFVDALIGLIYLVSFASRCKAGALIKGTLIYIILRPLWLLIKKIFGWIEAIFFGIPHVWRCALFLLAFLGTCFIFCVAAINDGIWFVPMMGFFTLVSAFVLYAAIMMKRLQKGGEEISRGNLGYKIDTSSMPRDFRLHGENLNRIGYGLSLAVEDKIKSERLKTELITNVSHDIKTPLTSIINYVDLIKKEETENEKIAEYIGVLDRQSARLKKLIDDLLEASKASTGNITVNPEKLEAGVLLGQAVGEYEERAAAASLDLILIKPPNPVYIKADGRLIWRMIDNLMSNICKYAQGGTRVYLCLEEDAGKAVLTFKNISKYQLNISEDELMERFVRGDASRNTEGSGLGLSITESLAKLQGGELRLTVDGDLFKAILTFPICNE